MAAGCRGLTAVRAHHSRRKPDLPTFTHLLRQCLEQAQAAVPPLVLPVSRYVADGGSDQGR